MPAADTARLIAELSLNDKRFSANADRAIGKVGALEKRFSTLDKVGQHASRGLSTAGRNLERGVVVGATAAIGALTYAVKEAVDQESAIAGIAKTVDGDISGVIDSLKTMSSQIPVSFGELAGIAELGGAMGIAKADLTAFTKQVAILGTTTNVSIEDAATALGQMQNVIGLTGDEFDNFAASLVDLGNKGNSTEAQILEIGRRSGGAAKLIGIAKDETLGWAAAAANLGLNEELAGTALQNFFVKTQKLVTGGGDKLDDFAKIAGRTAKQFKNDFNKDATGALTRFLKGLSSLTKGQRIKRIEQFFGKGSGMTRLVIGLADSLDTNLTPSIKTNQKAWEEASAAQAEADKRFATTASQMAILKNNINLAAATIGTELLPVLADLSKEGIAWLQDPATQKAIKAFAKDLGQGARSVAAFLKGVDWNDIGQSLKTAATFGKGLVDAFLAAPPWLQQFLVVGFAANKFTGGAITGIVGEIGKGLIKGVLGMNAGVVNINAATVNGGGLGGGVAGAAGKASVGSRILSGIKILGAVTIAGASIVALGEEFGRFQTKVTEAQTDLGKNVDATVTQDFKETIANLNATSAGIKQDWLGANLIKTVFGGSEIQQNFDMAAQRIIEAGNLTKSELIEAKAALVEARAAAADITGNTTAIDAALANIEKRLSGTQIPRDRPFVTPNAGLGENMRLNANSGLESVKSGVTRAIGELKTTVTQSNRSVGDIIASGNIKEQTALAFNLTALTAQTISQQTAAAAQALREAQTQAAVRQGTATVRQYGAAEVGATRSVAPPIIGALGLGFSYLASTIWQARPVIQSTTIVQKQAVAERGGSTSDSRTRSGV